MSKQYIIIIRQRAFISGHDLSILYLLVEDIKFFRLLII